MGLGSESRQAPAAAVNPAAPVRLGEVLYLHDHTTGFSKKSVMRWCVVVAIVGQHVRVVGRSASRGHGVFTPAATMAEFDRDGSFWPASARISFDDARRARSIGSLPEPYLGQVLAQYRRRRRRA